MTVQTLPQPQPVPGSDAAPLTKVPVAIGQQHRDLDQVWRFSLALAQSNLLPEGVRGKPADVMVTVLYGQELGLAPMQALQGIYVVNGRPTLAAQTWVALARQAGHKVRVIEETSTSCTVGVYRADDPEHPITGTFTLDDAQRAGLAGKAIWKAHPGAMLYARAASIALRRGCPEIALGFQSEDEADELAARDGTGRPTLAQAAARRAATTSAPASGDRSIDQPEANTKTEVLDAELVDAEHAAAVAELAAEHADTAAPPAAAPDHLAGGGSGPAARLHGLLLAHRIQGTFRGRMIRALAGRADATDTQHLTDSEAEQVLAQLRRITTGLSGDDVVAALDAVVGELEEQHGWTP